MPLSKVVSNSLSLTTLTSSGAGSIQGLTVGKGTNAVARNTAFGITALAAATGNFNTGIGNLALLTNSTGATNTAVGDSALKLNTTGGSNTAIGQGALESNTTASNNAAVGKDTLASNTTGASNTALGQAALAQNTTGPYNTAVGYQASYAGTTGERNTNLGYQAGYTPTTSSEHTFVGYKAGYAKTTGDACTFIGNIAGTAVTTGATNTFVGSNSGSTMTTGSQNTILGSYNGNQGGLDLRTSSNHVVLSDGAGNVRAYFDNTGICRMEPSAGGTGVLRAANLSNLSGDCGIVSSLGSNCSNTSSYFLIGTIRGVADRIYIYGNGNIQNTNGSYGAFSDVKLKENIVDATPKLADLMQVRVRNYNLKSDPTLKQIGVVAQELETIFPALVDESPDRDEEGNTLETTTKSVKYSVFVPMLIKAIQEQQALITQQATAITTLTTRITALEQA